MKNFSYNNIVTLTRTIYKGIGSLLKEIEDAMVKSISVGTVTTGEPGTDAEVSNSGTDQDVVLDFTIPRGDKGEQGEQGPEGPQGDPGTMEYEYIEDTETIHIF